MAVLGRLLFGSAERLDLPDLLSIDSYTAADFKYLLQTFIGGEVPYVLKGFDVIEPQDSIGTENVSIRVADSVVYYPGSSAGSFYYGLPEGNVNAQPVVPELRKNSTNFVYLTFNTFDTAKDSRAFWDPDQNGGDGGEFSQDINTESVLSIEVNVSVSTFPDNTIPICKITVGSTVIESIQDCRDMMFRLGKGGTSPDPFSTFTFRNDPSSLYARNEPSNTMTSALDPNPFQGGDKNLYTLKEWMDVVMTKLKELGGTTYWYEGASGGPSPTPTNTNIFLDALASTLKSKGQWQHSGVTAGQATWTQDIHYLSLRDPRDLIIRASTINLANDEVAWIKIIRDVEINGSNQSVAWLNASNIVNGVTGAFVNLSKGDWTKKKTDTTDKFLRVDEFYALPNLAGGTTTAALAQSIRLSDNYAGITGSEIGDYTKGEYLLTDVNITSRDDAAVQAAGGDFFWIAYRSDTILSLSGITPTQLTINITEADGQRARVTSSIANDLIDGDRITITTGPYAGTHTVEVADTTNFYIETAVTGDSLVQTAFYAVVTTAARSTSFGYSLETAAHGYESNQKITLQGTSSLYDGNYFINIRSTTSFQIPISSLIGNPGAIAGEIVLLPRMNVRTEFGTVKVVQGESIDIGDADSKNVLSYIGMESLAQLKPIYHLPTSYNALRGHANYNSASDDDLTVRAAKLTAMMADRVQDRGIQIIGRTNITSITSGINQQISALANLTLIKPSSPNQTITLTTPINLPANSAIVIDLDRDGSTAIVPVVISLGSQLLLQENRFILFYRFGTSTVYDWHGNLLQPYGHINTASPEDSQNKNIFVFNPGNMKLDVDTGLVTIDVVSAAETTNITTTVGAIIAPGAYFNFKSANNVTSYYVWYQVDGSGVDPMATGTGILVSVLSSDSADDVASLTDAAISAAAAADVSVSTLTNVVTITNLLDGPTTNASDGVVNTNFNIEIIIEGQDPSIDIYIPGSQKNVVDASAINTLGTLILGPDESAWVRINRFAAKTFNQVSTMDVNDTDVNGIIYITDVSSVPIDQDVIVLWTRVGNSLVITHLADHPEGNIYEEFLSVVVGAPVDAYEITGPISAGSEITIPPDSRDAGQAQRYIVGSGQLEVFLNGVFQRRLDDWAEVGNNGELSSRIEILVDLEVGDVLAFRIDGEGAVYFASAGGGAFSMQGAYDGGRFISVTAGQPIVITGSGGKLISIQGDMDVTGVIDPAGLTFSQELSDPLDAMDHGLWRDVADNLIYKRGLGTPVSLTSDLLYRDGSLPLTGDLDADGNKITNLGTPTLATDAATKGYVDGIDIVGVFVQLTNNTGSSIPMGSVVSLSQTVGGEIVLADADSITSSEGSIGIAAQVIPNASTGSVQISGKATVLGGPYALGRRVYVSKTAGVGTSTPPGLPGEVVFVIGFATTAGDVILAPYLDTVNSNIYLEEMTVVVGAPANDNQITGPVAPTTNITIPLDSRNSDVSKTYIVGSGQLAVYLNGVRLVNGSDYVEVGTIATLSSQIQTIDSLVVGDVLQFSIDPATSTYNMTGGGGGGGSLQDAYDAGRVISITSGAPIVINGPASEKLLVINGDLEVTGVIDPTAIQLTPQSSSPLPSDQAGIWVDMTGNLMHDKGDGGIPENISQAISGNIAVDAIKVILDNNTGVSIAALQPVGINSSGDIAGINVGLESSATAVAGIASALIPNSDSGDVVMAGVIRDVNLMFPKGSALYVAKSGGITSTKPDIGVDGFVAGDWIIRIGTLVKNRDNPSDVDLVVRINIVGQL